MKESTRTVARVSEKNGIPVITVNGEPIMEMAYVTYRPRHNRYADFARGGVKLFSVNLNVSEMPINERAPVLVFQKGIFEGEEPNFSVVDENLSQILEACPDAYVFLRVNLNLPRRWELEHPLELCEAGFGDRRRFSYASDAWAEEVERCLTALIRYVEASPYGDRVIGYQLAAGNTEEWLSIDPQSGYGPRAKEKFLAHCQEKGTSPTPEAYYGFMSELVASRIIRLADTAKALTHGDKLVGCFYGYTLFVGRSECHNALSKILKSESVDFLCSPLTYAELRRSGMDLYAMLPTASVRHHGKVYFSENDIRTHLSRPVHDHPNYTSPIWYGHEKPVVTEQMKLSFCRALLYGYGLWWFDMWGGWYGDEDYMALISAMSDLCGQGMDTPDAEVGVFVDEDSIPQAEHAPGITASAMRSLGLCGTPYDPYLASDFEEVFRRYKAFILIEPAETPRSRACAEAAARAAVPLLRMGSDVPSAEELRTWLSAAGVTLPVDRPAVVYRGVRYLSLYTPEAGVYDLCDGERRCFTDAFSGETVTFPCSLQGGRCLLFLREKP